MEYGGELLAKNAYRLLSSLVIPRPIAWVTTLNPDGSVNAAPFSYFNVMGSDPPLVVLGIADKEKSTPKDTYVNLERTSECVIHMVSEAMAEQMNQTSAALPFGESETEAAHLALVPSAAVAPPRLAHAPAALEGRLNQIVHIGGNHLLMVEIVHVFVQDRFTDAEKTASVRAEDMGLIGRVNGPSGYCRTSDRLQIARPK